MNVAEASSLYQQGISFKAGIKLYDSVARSERYYAGDQWKNTQAPDLPQPVLNFIGRICDKKISDIFGGGYKINFDAIQFPSNVVTQDAIDQLGAWLNENSSQLQPNGISARPMDVTNINKEASETSQLLTAMFETDWEKNCMSSLLLNGLQDAAISGDMLIYSYWDAAAETGQSNKGCIRFELIDNVNFYPTNPNNPDIQGQPSIVLAKRELESNVKAEAKSNGASKDDLKRITSDNDYLWQAGDMASHELMDNAGNKLVTLTALYRNSETGTIWALKCTKDGVVIRNPWDLKLKRYPLALMNWKTRKNCCHGVAETKGLIPVQRTTNQMIAMVALSLIYNVSPKPIVSKSALGASQWTNKIGEAIFVNGNVDDAAKYLQSGSVSSEAFAFPQAMIQLAMSMAGTSDVSMSSASFRNMSALSYAMSDIKAPNDNLKHRLQIFLKDLSSNWLDMIFAFYTQSRFVVLKSNDGGRFISVFDPKKVQKLIWDITIKPVQMSDWSEQAFMQTLNNMLNAGQLDMKAFIEAMPSSYMPEVTKQQILKSYDDAQAQQMAQLAMQAQGGQNPLQQAQQGATSNMAAIPGNSMPAMGEGAA